MKNKIRELNKIIPVVNNWIENYENVIVEVYDERKNEILTTFKMNKMVINDRLEILAKDKINDCYIGFEGIENIIFDGLTFIVTSNEFITTVNRDKKRA